MSSQRSSTSSPMEDRAQNRSDWKISLAQEFVKPLFSLGFRDWGCLAFVRLFGVGSEYVSNRRESCPCSPAFRHYLESIGSAT